MKDVDDVLELRRMDRPVGTAVMIFDNLDNTLPQTQMASHWADAAHATVGKGRVQKCPASRLVKLEA